MTAKKARTKTTVLSPQAQRARQLIDSIEWNTGIWIGYGWATPKLPAATEAVLRAAAEGRAIDPAELASVLAAAKSLEESLSWGTLKRFPTISDAPNL